MYVYFFISIYIFVYKIQKSFYYYHLRAIIKKKEKIIKKRKRVKKETNNDLKIFQIFFKIYLNYCNLKEAL